MANITLNSQYGIVLDNAASVVLYKNGCKRTCFNADSSNTFNNCRSFVCNLQDLVSNISMDKVTNASYMYQNCRNLTGSPVCGASVTNASNMYSGCNNLTGSPACGASVTNASFMYANCYSLTGSPVCGVNVTDAVGMYYYCDKLTGGGTLYLNNCENCYYMLYGVPTTNRRNIHVKPSSTLDFALKSSLTAGNIYGSKITWTDMTNGYYNTTYNIYVYNNGT